MADLFNHINKGHEYTCSDEKAFSWQTMGLSNLSGHRVCVLIIDENNGIAAVELVADRHRIFDVELSSLKK